MTRAIVTAVDLQRSIFAAETAEGVCAVFAWHGDPPVRAGDVVEGPVLATGGQQLRQGEGICSVVGLSGPVSRAQALEWLGRAAW